MNRVDGDVANVVQAQEIGAVHIHRGGARSRPRLRVVESWSPFALQVHRPLETDGLGEPLPELTPYVRREHDEELNKALCDLTKNNLVVLVGGSATGKTRALWEAVSTHVVLKDWQLVYPRTGADLLELLVHEAIEPGTVLWLNEMHNYITGPSGESVAAKLHVLVQEGFPSLPVVVVGTLWPEFWEMLVSEPMSLDDPHSSARLLLDSKARIEVADAFSERTVDMLCHGLDVDPRLRIAAKAAGERRAVIQTLVGGPNLVRRFESPSTPVDRYATAVVSGALDARRLGHRQPFLTAFLAKASATYLAEDDRIDAPPDWFDQGLRRAARDRSHGVTALLPRRIRDDQAGAADSYDLHDYLEQHSWRSRRFQPIPPSLWEVSLDHSATLRDLSALGNSAFVRLIYGAAEPLLSAAAEGGDDTARFRLADLFVQQHRYDEAVMTLGRSATAGDGPARRSLIDVLALMQADEGLQDLAAGGDRYATWRLADVLEERGDLERLPGLLSQCDDSASRSRLIGVLQKLGRVDEALDLLRHGNSAAHFRMIGMMRDHGMLDELKNFEHFEDACVMGGFCAQHAKSQLVELLAERGELDPVRRLAENADVVDRRQYALILWKHGHNEDARSIMRTAADAGDLMAMRYVGDMYPFKKQPGRRPEEVPKVLEPSALHRQANRLAEEKNVSALRRLADTGYEYAHWRLMNLLGELGDVELLESAANSGDVRAHRRLVEILSGLGRVDELGSRAARGDGIARAELLWLASARGHTAHEDAVDVLRFGVRTDGSRARPCVPGIDQSREPTVRDTGGHRARQVLR